MVIDVIITQENYNPCDRGEDEEVWEEMVKIK